MPSHQLTGTPTTIDDTGAATITVTNTGNVAVLVRPLGRQVMPGGTVTVPAWNKVKTVVHTAGQQGSVTVTTTPGVRADQPGPGPVQINTGGLGSMSATIIGGDWFYDEGLTNPITFPITVASKVDIYPQDEASCFITGTVSGVSKTYGTRVRDGSYEVYEFSELFASVKELADSGLLGGAAASTTISDRGTWAPGVSYSAGDVVANGVFKYIALGTHTSAASFAADSPSWVLTGTTTSGGNLVDRGAWAPATSYVIGDVVTFNGARYAANVAHTSAGTFAPDISKWTQTSSDPVTFAGQYVGSNSTVATLPSTKSGGGALVNGDWSLLTAVDGANQPGMYFWNGLAWTFGVSVASGLAGTQAMFTTGTDTADRLWSAANLRAASRTDEVNRGVVQAWDVARSYATNQLAVDAGRVWRATTITTVGAVPSSTPGEWVEVGAAPSVRGCYIGQAATYAALPATDTDATTAREVDDWAILTADDIGTGTVIAPQYPRGIYTWNGASYVLGLSLRSSAVDITDAGLWATGTVYAEGAVVRDPAGFRWISVDAHTAGATFAGDAAHWAAVDRPIPPSVHDSAVAIARPITRADNGAQFHTEGGAGYTLTASDVDDGFAVTVTDTSGAGDTIPVVGFAGGFVHPGGAAVGAAITVPANGWVRVEVVNNAGNKFVNVHTASGDSHFTPTLKAVDYTAAANDYVEVDATAAARIITLPSAAPAGARVLVRRNAGTNGITVVPSGTGSIDGDTAGASITGGIGTGAIFESAGSDVWYLIADVAGQSTLTGLVGATAVADGAAGIAPQPLIADRGQFLRGDATWADVVGTYVGTGATYATLPATRVDTTDLVDGDLAVLTVADIGTGTALVPQYPRGLYRRAAGAWVLDAAMPLGGNVSGLDTGTGATYATLPTTRVDTTALQDGDISFLTADTVGTGTAAAPQFPRGIYVRAGGLWALQAAVPIDPVFTGATALLAGAIGNVPAPAAGQQGRYLRGDGTWAIVSSHFNPTAQSADYTALVDDYVQMDATAAARTVTLPAAAAAGSRVLVRKTAGTNAVAVVASGGGTIDGDAGGASITGGVGCGAIFETSGANVWYLIADIAGQSSVPTLIGATAVAAGTAGIVPQPQIVDRNSALFGDGTWQQVARPWTWTAGNTDKTLAAWEAIRFSAAAGSRTLTLPASPGAGTRVFVRRTDAVGGNTLTVVPSGGGTVNGDPDMGILTAAMAIVENVTGNEWEITGAFF